jgi:hypothetical protein
VGVQRVCTWISTGDMEVDASVAKEDASVKGLVKMRANYAMNGRLECDLWGNY